MFFGMLGERSGVRGPANVGQKVREGASFVQRMGGKFGVRLEVVMKLANFCR